jgi:hypothetical protein
MEAAAAEYGGGNSHRGRGWRKECHGMHVNFGHDVSCIWCVWIFVGKAVTPLLDCSHTIFITVLIVHIVGIVRVHIRDSKP